MRDKVYMQRALELAVKGRGHTSPNPVVGAVIVKDDLIIGEGYHEVYGGLHAERNALKKCGIRSTKGAEMYVTLEPCSHYGKQPPCVDAIIEAGISRVVVGAGDPNPLVAGRGIKILREHGIEVVEGILEEECNKVNEVFFHYITTNMPFVAMKYAMTMDGKIATFTGHSKWVTGEKARKHVQKLRNDYTGIMVGIGTVLADNPSLTCRIDGGVNPIRIICDSSLRTPLDFDVVKTAKDVKTIIGTCVNDETKISKYEEQGVKVIKVSKKNGHIDIREFLEKLGKEGIDSILLEGGGTLNWDFLEEGLVNRVYTYMAPKLIGGSNAKTPIEGYGIEDMGKALKLKTERVLTLGGDILIESEVI